MFLSQRMHFLQDMFQITAIALISVRNHYHINGLHPFWENLYNFPSQFRIRIEAVIEAEGCYIEQMSAQLDNQVTWIVVFNKSFKIKLLCCFLSDDNFIVPPCISFYLPMAGIEPVTSKWFHWDA